MNEQLLSELNAIQQYEDLHHSKAKLKKIYNQIAQLIIDVHENPKIEKTFEDVENVELSEKIQERLYELYEMDGRIKDFLEECQEEGYKQLRKTFNL